MKNKMLVISPHPDDETLGAGGTILKYKDAGDMIYWLNVTNMKKGYGFTAKEIHKRKKEIENVIKMYNVDRFFDLGLRPARLDGYPIDFIVQQISKILGKIEPNIIILPYKNDVHSDHRIVFESSYACTKIFRHKYIQKILMMEIISETDFATYDEGFVPNCFVDISDYFYEKMEIKKIYKDELGEHPFPRNVENIRALATRRGSQAGCEYAESFIILKEIW